MSIQIICKALFESFLLFLYLDQTWSLTNPSKTKSLVSRERVVKRQRLKMIAHCQINPNIKIRLLIHVNVVDSIKQHAIIYSLCGSVCNKMFPIFSPWILHPLACLIWWSFIRLKTINSISKNDFASTTFSLTSPKVGYRCGSEKFSQFM